MEAGTSNPRWFPAASSWKADLQLSVDAAWRSLTEGLRERGLLSPRVVPSGLGMSGAVASAGAKGGDVEVPAWQKRQDQQMAAWRKDPSWTDETPKVNMCIPQGAFCQLDTTATLAIPPDAAYTIINDPGNARVFKNIRGVNFRKVLSQKGEKQTVELEQNAVWRFLFLSGTFAVRIIVEDDRPNYRLSFKLSRPGFMKVFQGYWQLEPIALPPSSVLKAQQSIEDGILGPSHCDQGEEGWGMSPGKAWNGPGPRMGTKARLVQEVEPALMPPPWLAGYLRGITTKATMDVFTDFQIEAARLRYGLPKDCDVQKELRRMFEREEGVEREEGSGAGGTRERSYWEKATPEWGRGRSERRRQRKKGLDGAGSVGALDSPRVTRRRSQRLSEKDKWRTDAE